MNIKISKPRSATPQQSEFCWAPIVELESGDRLVVKVAGGPAIRMRLTEGGNFRILADTPDDQNRGGVKAGTRPGIYEIEIDKEDEEDDD